MAWRNIGNDPFDEDATSSSSADSHERDQEEPEARGNVFGAIGDNRNVVEVVEQPVLDLVAAMNGAGMNGPGAGAGAGGNGQSIRRLNRKSAIDIGNDESTEYV